MIRSRFPILAVVIACTGCGAGGTQPITGTVTRDGTPLAAGAVAFEPVSAGPAATAAIANGAFTVPAARGLKPGQYKVRVSPPTVASGTDPKVLALTQFTPWETTVEVVSGQPVVFAVPKDDPAKKPKPPVSGKS
ncbi:MAG: hypothetical protein ACRC7O_17380 [Fimbriiglobus sp.]